MFPMDQLLTEKGNKMEMPATANQISWGSKKVFFFFES